MEKLFVLAAAACVVASAFLSPARAESRSTSCQSIDGQTVCLSSSGGTGTSLACQSINGRTRCVGSGGVRCETDRDGHMACKGGDGRTRVETHGPTMPGQDADAGDDEDP